MSEIYARAGRHRRGATNPAKPFGNRLEWGDDAARIVHDYRTGQDVARP